jgi:glucan phosphoethanolaminetransferase (alkaline phosphatase superfamily)
VIADTHADEVLSWLGPWLWPALALAAGWLLLVAWAGRQWWRADIRWRHRSRWWVLLAAAAMVALWAMIDGTGAEDTDPERRPDYVRHAPPFADDGLLAQLADTYPWGLPLRWRRFMADRAALAAHRAETAQFDFGVRWTDPALASQPQVHVLVIGESSRPDRWGLFGAARDTTPRLSARTDLLRLDNAVSAASATREAVTLMLTRRSPQAMLQPLVEPSLITAFRQAGFRTYWLSTQGLAGGHETPISVLADEADEHQYLNAADYRAAGALDGALLPALRQVLARGEPRQLIVLHTLGSHLHYAHRYPPSFAHFTPALGPDDKPDIWRNTQGERLTNAYDNSLRYTDAVLADALEALAQRPGIASLTYVSDHGETLYDGRCGRGGHGFASLANYRVPLFTWLSPAQRAAQPERLAALQAHRQTPVSALSLFATLTGHAGFTIRDPHAHGDIGAADFRPAARRVTHFGDADTQLPALACESPPAVTATSTAAPASTAASSASPAR